MLGPMPFVVRFRADGRPPKVAVPLDLPNEAFLAVMDRWAAKPITGCPLVFADGLCDAMFEATGFGFVVAGPSVCVCGERP